MNEEHLPPFAEQWMQQWKSAAPKLQAIRDQELRDLNQTANQSANSSKASRKLSHAEARNNGLAIQQAWFMRFMLLERSKSDETKRVSSVE